MKSQSGFLLSVLWILLAQLSCNTNDPAPVLATLTTSAITSIEYADALSGGNITSDGGSAVTERGVCWSTNSAPTIDNARTRNGSGKGLFAGQLLFLNPGTTYFVRAYATTLVGTAYGSEVSFATLALPVPVVTTTAVTGITLSAAMSGGNVMPAPGFPPVTERGVCWSTSSTPTIAGSKVLDIGTGSSFASTINSLLPGTTYFVRAFATSFAGTGYGSVISFTTQVADIDGNVYDAVNIGAQTWMVENLKVSTYKDGTAIPLVTGFTAWGNLSTPGFCWYNNDAPTYKPSYGALYNWYAVNSGKVCPAGWHVPTDVELSTLINYLGPGVAGGKLKATGTTYWNSPNTGATNSSGFTALPGGLRGHDGSFYFAGQFGYWWSSSEDGVGGGYNKALGYQSGGEYGNDGNKHSGYSVRCMKD